MTERQARQLSAQGCPVRTGKDDGGLREGSFGYLVRWSIAGGRGLLTGIGSMGFDPMGGCAWAHLDNLERVSVAGPND